MDICQWPWYELLFRSKFRYKYGDDFDRFFKDIMSRRYPSDFQRVKPAGPHGDRKCDGLLVSSRQLFQCYAPERMETKRTIGKIEDDFLGAIEHWGSDFDEWVFVHNQWHGGLPPDVTKSLLNWNGHQGKRVIQWCEVEIGNVVYGLRDSDLVGLFGPPFDPRAARSVGFEQLRQVLQHIATTPPQPTSSVAPVPEGKVEHNHLQDYLGWLNTGRQKQRVVEDFFKRWPDPELGQRIEQVFKQRYEALRDSDFPPSTIFGQLWSFAGGGSFAPDMALENAVLALVSFLFDQCDIFEAPPARSLP